MYKWRVHVKIAKNKSAPQHKSESRTQRRFARDSLSCALLSKSTPGRHSARRVSFLHQGNRGQADFFTSILPQQLGRGETQRFLDRPTALARILDATWATPNESAKYEKKGSLWGTSTTKQTTTSAKNQRDVSQHVGIVIVNASTVNTLFGTPVNKII